MSNSKAIRSSARRMKNVIRLLDGRKIKISINEPFTIKGDVKTHSWNLSWLKNNTEWGSLMQYSLLQLLQTHSLPYAHTVYYASRALFNRSLFHLEVQLDLDTVARTPELIPMSSWCFLLPLLKRMAIQDEYGALSDDLKNFLTQPSKWETKGKGKYFALIANDPEHGAFTEQELFSIQEGVNSAYEKNRISLADYALVWFLIATGVRPVQIARMKVGDVKFYNGPEGTEVTLLIPLAKGQASPDQGKWRRRCPTILAEILIEYLNHYKFKMEEALFVDQSTKVTYALKSIFRKVQTYSNRNDTEIHVFPYRFRYTLGTRAIALGASDQEVARLLTHRSTSCIKAYRAAMPELQKPIKEALSGEMSIIASAFQGKIIENLNNATRKGQVDALIRDFMHLNGEAIGACGTEARCYQHAPKACLMCRKFEPFADAPWDELLIELQSDMDSETEDKIKLITFPFIQAVKAIQKKCEEMKRN